MHLNDFYKAFHKRFVVAQPTRPNKLTKLARLSVVVAVLLMTSGCAVLLKYLQTLSF